MMMILEMMMKVTFLKNKTFENEIAKIMTIRRISLIRLIIAFAMIFDDYAFFSFSYYYFLLLILPSSPVIYSLYPLLFYVILSSYFLSLFSFSSSSFLSLSLPSPPYVNFHPYFPYYCCYYFLYFIFLPYCIVIHDNYTKNYHIFAEKNITITVTLCLSYEYAN